MQSLTEFGPVWALCGILLAANIKLVYSVIELVKNNTSAMQKLTDVISRCPTNKDN
jgi:hypothetical protein